MDLKSLPEEILLQIFKYLDFEDALNIKSIPFFDRIISSFLVTKKVKLTSPAKIIRISKTNPDTSLYLSSILTGDSKLKDVLKNFVENAPNFLSFIYLPEVYLILPDIYHRRESDVEFFSKFYKHGRQYFSSLPKDNKITLK